MENIKYIHNSSYLIDNLNIKKEKYKLYISIFIILLQILFIINFKFYQTISFEIENQKNITLDLKTKNIDLFINDIKYNKELNISMENHQYKLKIDLNKYTDKRIKIKVNEKLSILDSILYDIRKDLYNERTK